MGVGSEGVVESRDIGQQTLLELLDSQKAAPVQFLFFQILEKALHNSVVIGVALGGKGLDHLQFVDDLAEVPGSKLRALICMKHDAFGNASQPYSIPQGVNRQEAVDFTSNPAGDDLSGIEIQDGTDVMEPSAHFYIGKVADPYQIGGFLVKSLGKKILTDTGILSAYRRFWWFNGAHFGQPHLFHQPVHPTFADGNAILPRKTKGYLLDSQPFVGAGINLQYPLPNLHVLLLPLGGLTPQVFVIGAAVDVKRPAENGDGILTGQGVDGFQPLPECGVKIAIAFFKMRFSSSSSALRFCRALICCAVRIVSSSTFT